MSLYERVARKMAASHSVGPFASYETILAALRKRYPTEAELRSHIAELEAEARELGLGGANSRFLEDDTC